MTERDDLLRELLRERIAENRAELERRQAEREQDPLWADDYERSCEAEEQRQAALVERKDAGAGLVYRRQENALQPPTAREETALYELRSDVDAVVEFCHTAADELDILRRENVKLRSQLNLVVKLLAARSKPSA